MTDLCHPHTPTEWFSPTSCFKCPVTSSTAEAPELFLVPHSPVGVHRTTETASNTQVLQRIEKTETVFFPFFKTMPFKRRKKQSLKNIYAGLCPKYLSDKCTKKKSFYCSAHCSCKTSVLKYRLLFLFFSSTKHEVGSICDNTNKFPVSQLINRGIISNSEAVDSFFFLCTMH